MGHKIGPEKDPNEYGQPIFNKDRKATQCREATLLNKWYWNNWDS